MAANRSLDTDTSALMMVFSILDHERLEFAEKVLVA